MKKIVLYILVFIVTGFSIKKTHLENTTWRGELLRPDGKIISFNFETKDSLGKKIIYFQNAEERILADNIEITGDSVHIQMPFFDSKIEAKILSDGSLEGEWIKQLEKETKAIDFRATPGNFQRFDTKKNDPQYSVDGRWAVDFTDISTKEITHSVGEFKQRGNIVTGTFLNPTGDYRYLEGIVKKDSLMLSCFDGGHAFLFTAKINDDKTLSDGYYYSGATYYEKWVAKKDSKATPEDEYSLTKLKPGIPKLNFSFKSIDGNMVSINDQRFKNKVVLVQIMGSWCPNCMDETRFLSAYYNQQKNKEVEIISLAYERSTDFERAKKGIQTFQKKFDVKYPMLVTGVTVTDSLRTEKTLPQLEKIKGFPTLIIIDKKGFIRKIHTGFTGPGTGEHYEQFKDDFTKLINGLLREK